LDDEQMPFDGPPGSDDRRSPRVGRARPVNAQNWALPFVREIAEGDEMAGSATPRQYYHLGFAALDSIQRGLTAAEFDRSPRTVLDFACGHGRVLRMLVAAFPEAEFTACDVNRDGIDFCRRKFGATPVLGNEVAEEVELPGRYELIWVGSLFTHLDAPRWTSFLSLLARHLEPGGVLVFTTHGRGSIEELRVGARSFTVENVADLLAGCDRDGFAYQHYLGHGNFGISLSRPWWVCSELERHPELELVSFTEGGWNGRQDTVVCRAL
jgi:SAM-dependent methyltransferase